MKSYHLALDREIRFESLYTICGGGTSFFQLQSAPTHLHQIFLLDRQKAIADRKHRQQAQHYAKPVSIASAAWSHNGFVGGIFKPPKGPIRSSRTA
ncbi:MAG: hypothetical protein KGJ79_08310 [Alphaproteobacteria bacterium]|nr:hypothetical protein [Alphaproteobacteria bacterium]MDE2495950.1 hypothetical protein [Alphaproteobacteria bacterium]